MSSLITHPTPLRDPLIVQLEMDQGLNAEVLQAAIRYRRTRLADMQHESSQVALEIRVLEGARVRLEGQ